MSICLRQPHYVTQVGLHHHNLPGVVITNALNVDHCLRVTQRFPPSLMPLMTLREKLGDYLKMSMDIL